MNPARVETPLGQILENEGRSQAWLAREVGSTRSQIWSYVWGLHVPEQPMQDKIAQALQRPVVDVFPPNADRAAA